MKKLFFLLLINSAISAQELYQTDYEKGYVKDGLKISVWQYFNSKREPELVINHTTGRVTYMIKDTTDYVVFRNGEWVSSRLDVHPVPLAGSYNFYQSINSKIIYPGRDFKNGLEGMVTVFFDVDTLGTTINYTVVKDIGGSCDSSVVASLKAVDQKWIPAQIAKRKYSARFAINFEFRVKHLEKPLEHEKITKGAKFLEDIIVNQTKLADENKTFTFVEKSAEPVGGMEEFYRWFGRNLHYPDYARRMGIEGKVFIKFTIEPTGAITNAEVVRGFNKACDQEALRVISISPNWKPGTIKDEAVRQSYVIPITFKLDGGLKRNK